VATFLPLLALLLMAFGKRGEIVTQISSKPQTAIIPSESVQNQYEQFKRKIEIKKDGNYIDNKLCSLEEITIKGKEWYKASNDWILLLVDESIPLSRIDEVRGTLKNYFVVQTTVGSDDLIYFMGDVSDMAKFKQGKFNDWMSNQLANYPELKSKFKDYQISYSFIIDKTGKVRDSHITKISAFPEVNAVYEKILTQIPDWEPAKRLGTSIGVYYNMSTIGKSYTPPKK
jgi:hypothetical protein